LRDNGVAMLTSECVWQTCDQRNILRYCARTTTWVTDMPFLNTLFQNEKKTGFYRGTRKKVETVKDIKDTKGT